jgi:hypothetical protein
VDDGRCSWLNQGGTTELLKPPSLGVGMEAFVFLQTAENDRQLRSRLEGILNVPEGTPAVPSAPAALLDDRFEQSELKRG